MMNTLVWMTNDKACSNKKVGGVVHFKYVGGVGGNTYFKKSFDSLELAKKWAANYADKFEDYFVTEA